MKRKTLKVTPWRQYFRTLLTLAITTLATILYSAERPNVLLILVDDAGYNDFSFMGSKDFDTPHIDRLAESGVIFTDAHVSATVCSPSRAGLITGRYQQRFGHENNVPPHTTGMDVEESTLGDVLGGVGYRTIVIGKWHLGNRSMYHPNTRGFETFYGFLEGARDYFPNPKVDDPENFRAMLDNRLQVDFEGYLTDVLTDRAIEEVQSEDSRPWFMFLSYNAVHTPMHAKKEDLKRFEGHPRQKLAAMTYSLDQNVGRMMSALEASDQLDNTIVYFLSDNGGAGMNNNQSSNEPLKGWKGNKFEGGHRVPFIMSWPAEIEGGQHYDGLTSALDIFSTSIAAAGLKETTGKPLDGVDLVPFLKGEEAGEPHETLFWRKDQMAAVRKGAHKLVRLEGYGYRLYDLENDLGESVDLSDSKPDLLKEMAQDLTNWERALVVPYWWEEERWTSVTYEIHRALMDNEEPRFRSPDEKEAYLQANPKKGKKSKH
ncbi:sulfatase-like hydrolase/transferase [Pelagicoccus mobilis]|uniref:Sulfatase-like hydrolase/transferase n=1 Tax=Pelagicoccus mobilis TaxID=415221 RepID=A0A934RW35_9BACT|nr:sulfatase-like hydrolase/transferase [Pelagicoccus mobilis]MBK1875866.1 sulfatase-like hydrolase/transferase [Pelagicoccus mobilis]